ncbi:DNA cytosine methyltransferase [Spirulina subsalsa FACHB-351]|uniref:DNA (cytosine-5-)-methyltransferase n=1 Tax=Spirulina subsalsa FACHB-351 TaxID=234711 RepID=A0ABT3LA36_9CYAN|nr:DNA cytosine methyltransferase [Spirulina subsalsa FACHB-351]
MNLSQPNIVALFAGCGGLDLGFRQAGFNIIWANEYDKEIWSTYEKNHPQTFLDRRDIRKIPSAEIPNCTGIIGGPPCQSWSEGGCQRGIEDERGRLFLEYIRILQDKQPQFFLAENVSGILHKKHEAALKNILAAFEEAGYIVSLKLLNGKDYQVPQDRKRVILVGYHVSLNKKFTFPEPNPNHLTLKDTIWDLKESALPAQEKNKTNGSQCIVPNHEYMTGGFSTIYLSRNRVRCWDEPSFTIQAGGRHASIHPQANKMIHVEKDHFIFDPNSPYPYRRLSIRECARIQTFPDSFIFDYQNLASAYKMIGNAVPVNLAYALARVIFDDLRGVASFTEKEKTGYSRGFCPQNLGRIKG